MTPATAARSALLALPLALTLTAIAGAPASLAQTPPQATQSAPTTAPAPRQAGAGQGTPGQGTSGQGTSGQPNPTRAAPQPAARQSHPGQANPGQATPAGSVAGRPAGARRRPKVSYAACNRQAHTRGLRGGARRRFLIRCKLGYETPRPPQVAPSRQP